MRGTGVVRHCGSCARDVYDLSSMTAQQAEVRLLNAHDLAPCIRYARDTDGSVVHLAAATPYPPSSWAPRGVAVATALGVTLVAATLHAETPKQPAQCVAYAQPVLAAAAAPQVGGAAAPAAAPPMAAPPMPPIAEPLGGAPPPAQEQAIYGTLSMKSKLPRRVTLIGIPLVAPLPSYLLTPGTFIADVVEPDGKARHVRFVIRKDKTTVVDLDAPTKKRR